jgi:hypothetical protein
MERRRYTPLILRGKSRPNISSARDALRGGGDPD